MTHTREVLEKLGDIAARLSEVESAARSFAISGKQSHLSPFYTAAEAVPPQVNELKLLLRDDRGGLRSVTNIEPVIARHLKVMKDMVELGDKNLFRGYGQRSLTDEGNILMEQIRAAFSTMDKEQRARLDQEQTTVAAKAARVTMISWPEVCWPACWFWRAARARCSPCTAAERRRKNWTDYWVRCRTPW